MSRDLPPPPDDGFEFDYDAGSSDLPPVPGHDVAPVFDYPDEADLPPSEVNPPPPPGSFDEPATGLPGLPPPPTGQQKTVPPPPSHGVVDDGMYDYDYDGGTGTAGDGGVDGADGAEGGTPPKEGGWCGPRGVGCEGTLCYFRCNEVPMCGFNPDYISSIKEYPYVPKPDEEVGEFEGQYQEDGETAKAMIGKPERILLWMNHIEHTVHLLTYIVNAVVFCFYLAVVFLGAADPIYFPLAIGVPLGGVLSMILIVPIEFFGRHWQLYRIFMMMKVETKAGTGKSCMRVCLWVTYSICTTVSLVLHFNALVGWTGGVGVFSLATCLIRAGTVAREYHYVVAFMAGISTLFWAFSCLVSVLLVVMLILRCIRTQAEQRALAIDQEGLAKDASIVSAMVPWLGGAGDAEAGE